MMICRKLKKYMAFFLTLMMLVMVISPYTMWTVDAASGVSVLVEVENTTFSQGQGASWDGQLVQKWVTVPANSTVIDATAKAFEGTSYEVVGMESNYISGIHGVNAFDGGSESGWMVTLNDWFTHVGAGDIEVEQGDIVRWVYTKNGYGKDVGGSWDNNDKTIQSIRFSEGTLSPSFNQEINSYTLELSKGIASVDVEPTASNKNFLIKTFVDGTHYKRTQSIPVSNGTVITVICGDPAWPTMNSWSGASDVLAETYQITIVSPQDTSDVDTTVLDTAIFDAHANITGAAISIDGKDIDTANQWVRQSDIETYLDAVKDAKAVRDGLDVTQTDIDHAVQALAQATDIFNAAKKYGLKSTDIPVTPQIALNKLTDYYKDNQPTSPSGSWEAFVGLWGAGEDLSTSPWEDASWKTLDPGFDSQTNANDHIYYIYSLLSVGKNPAKAFETERNLFLELSAQQDPDSGSFGSLGKHIWAIVALDVGEILGVDVGTWNASNKEKAIDHLILQQNLDGSFGAFSQIDYTGWSLVALSKANGPTVDTSIVKAKQYLKSMQQESGGFGGSGMWDAENSNSIACAIQGLIAIGEDVTSIDGAWNYNGKTPIDALLSYQNSEGAFDWQKDNPGAVFMSTKQASVALADSVSGQSTWYKLGTIDLGYTQVDKAKLNTLITQVKSNLEQTPISVDGKDVDLGKNWVTQEEHSVLTSALATAQITADKADALQQEINDALAQLNGANEQFNQAKKTPINVIQLPAPDEQNTITVDVQLLEGIDQIVPVASSEHTIRINVAQDMASKVMLELPVMDAMPRIEVIKENTQVVFPQGIQVTPQDSASIELITYQEPTDYLSVLEPHIAKDKKIHEIPQAFTMGGNHKIEFNGYVHMQFSKKAGHLVAAINGENIELLSKYANDAEGLASGKDAYAFDSGDDLIVKTKHFTDYVVYSLRDADDDVVIEPEKKVKLSVDKRTIGKGYVISSTYVELQDGDTAWSVLKRALDARKIRYDYKWYDKFESVYVQSIDGDGEFDHGPLSGWMYSVNGRYPDYGASQYDLKEGDVLRWRYTTDLGEDLGQDNSKWSGDLKANKKAYVIEVDGDSEKVSISKRHFDKALKAVEKEKLSDIVIKIDTNKKMKGFNIELPKKSIESVAKQKGLDLNIESSIAHLDMSNAMLALLAKQAKGETIVVQLQETDALTLTEKQRETIGHHVVYDIVIESAGESIRDSGKKKVTIALPYTLKAGETKEEVNVWSLDENNQLKRIESDYNSKTNMASFDSSYLSSYAIGVKLEASAVVHRFKDVKPEDWFYKAVDVATQKGLFVGTSSETFSPNQPMTRAMLVTVLHKLEKEPDASPVKFHDVPEATWFTTSVGWAADNGIISGYDNGVFKPNEKITREQIAVILYRYGTLKGYDMDGEVSLTMYMDQSKISPWALESMRWASQSGIITGRTSSTLSPAGEATRAEVAEILRRFIEKYEQQ